MRQTHHQILHGKQSRPDPADLSCGRRRQKERRGLADTQPFRGPAVHPGRSKQRVLGSVYRDRNYLKTICACERGEDGRLHLAEGTISREEIEQPRGLSQMQKSLVAPAGLLRARDRDPGGDGGVLHSGIQLGILPQDTLPGPREFLRPVKDQLLVRKIGVNVLFCRLLDRPVQERLRLLSHLLHGGGKPFGDNAIPGPNRPLGLPMPEPPLLPSIEINRAGECLPAFNIGGIGRGCVHGGFCRGNGGDRTHLDKQTDK